MTSITYLLERFTRERAARGSRRVPARSLAGWVKKGEMPSPAMLVARRGVIVLHEAFGVRRQEDTTPTLKL